MEKVIPRGGCFYTPNDFRDSHKRRTEMENDNRKIHNKENYNRKKGTIRKTITENGTNQKNYNRKRNKSEKL
jgi:hypothetical protein